MSALLTAFAWLRSSWLGRALAAAGALALAVVLLRRDAARDALRDRDATEAEDRARRNEAGRAAGARAARETRDAPPEDVVRAIRGRDGEWD